MADREQIKATFVETFGTWGDEWQSVLELDPAFLERYIDFAAVPQRNGTLDPKVRAFVAITVASAATHLHRPSVEQYIEAALKAGATSQEVMEVLECTSTLGIHAMNLGVPVLVEVLTERGDRTGPSPLDEYQERLKAEFTEARGYWNPTWDEMLELDPHLFEAYTAYSSHPWLEGTLSPKVREFLYIAFDTSATHQYRVGLKLHIENALGYGATVQEVLEVMEIASTIGMESVTMGASILADQLRRRDQD